MHPIMELHFSSSFSLYIRTYHLLLVDGIKLYEPESDRLRYRRNSSVKGRRQYAAIKP